MKRIPEKKHSIFIVCITAVIACALLSTALFLPGSSRTSASEISQIEKSQHDQDSSAEETADAENAQTVSAEEKSSAEKNENTGTSDTEHTSQPSAPESTDSTQNNHTDSKENDSGSKDQQNPQTPPDTQGGDTGVRYAYLTFDDGPSKNTDAILKILAENNIKATFFVTARNTDETNMQRYRKIAEAGHTLAMHSGTHNYREIYASKEAFLADYSRISDLLYEITGTRSLIYRFPGGSSNTLACRKVPMTELIAELHRRGVEYFDWNVNSTDASGKNPDPAVLVKSVASGLKYRHNIILMHDAAGHETTVQALPSIIQACRDRGLTFSVITPQTPPAHHRTTD